MYYKKGFFNLSLFSVLFLFTIAGCQQQNFDKNKELSKYELTFKELHNTWDEGIPRGNATLGPLSWRTERPLRFSLYRTDLWYLRPMDDLYFQAYGVDRLIQEREHNTYIFVHS